MELVLTHSIKQIITFLENNIMIRAMWLQLLLTLLFLQSSCTNSKYVQKENADINAVTELIEIQDTFSLRILYYVPGFACDTITSASETIGVRQGVNDTIRVYTLCNSDIFKEGTIVRVFPRPVPNIAKIRLGNRQVHRGREYVYPEIYKRKLKTIYGDLSK